jgi:phosphatidylserine/phosphatidylglycerophosphate/cardiolipin synthase-like enzyme
LAFLLLALSACSITPTQTGCPAGRQELPDCPPLEAVQDPQIEALYKQRDFHHPEKSQVDTIELGKHADIPVLQARGKILGTSHEAALDSLAAKLWMIENADHTIDMVYYIYKNDLIGQALMGALCNAVARGVDIRFMVDSTGSIAMPRATLRSLATCADRAGFIRTADGRISTRRARLQVAVFSPISKLVANANRRSHDKLIVVDGSFPDKAAAMTGGRNISVDYYGIDQDGSVNEDTYRDAEILLRDGPAGEPSLPGMGKLTESYVTVLFLFEDNTRLIPIPGERAQARYRRDRAAAQASLKRLKALPLLQAHLEGMPHYMNQGFEQADTLLAHELGNLTDTNVVYRATENISSNPNSIMYVLRQIAETWPGERQSRYVSPYLFLARYEDRDGNLLLDEAENTLKWLEEHPGASIEIVTNSILTSDNFSAQSIIDMETAPRLLLDPETREAWLAAKEEGESIPELVRSERWLQQVNHPRILIYQTGKSDSALLPGGTVHYGKMHAKYLVEDDIGFVGTSNFDYRSRLFNNEMGYFFRSRGLADELHREFEELKANSYLWGTPEWFEMRRQVMKLGGMKGWSSRKQRTVYRSLKNLGLDWLF